MTKKKVSPPTATEASAPSARETRTPSVVAPRQRPASAIPKSIAKVPAPTPTPKTTRPSAKPVASSEKSATSGARPPPSRSPRKATAGSSAPSPKRPATRVKKNGPPLSSDAPLNRAPMATDEALNADPVAVPPTQPHPTSTATPLLSVAELWEQGSPIRTRIAQLRTRNSLLEEQLQRLRPPVPVRGKKK